MNDLRDNLDALRRNSRRAALISLLGGMLVLATLLGSAWQVAHLRSRRASLKAEVAELEKAKERLKDAVLAEQDRRDLALAQLAQGQAQAAEDILEEPLAASKTPELTASEQARTSVPRIYFQLRAAEQAKGYEACVASLTGRGYRVPAYEMVANGPRRSELRYFHADEEDLAKSVAGAVETCLGTDLIVNFVGRYGNVKPRHLEIWLAAPEPDGRSSAGAGRGAR